MDPIIEAAGYQAARIIENELRAQAPSDAIAKGFVVLPVYTQVSEDEIDVDFEYFLEEEVFYGYFLNTGTLDELAPSDEAPWNPTPGKGQGGIKPRYWMNLPEEVQFRIDMIIDLALEEATDKKVEQELDKQFNT